MFQLPAGKSLVSHPKDLGPRTFFFYLPPLLPSSPLWGEETVGLMASERGCFALAKLELKY